MQRTFLIIGGLTGIGAALKDRLKAEGHVVLTASRSPAPEGSEGHGVWDVRTPGGLDPERLPEALHGLVYCPGTINLMPFDRLIDDDFVADFEVNLLGAVRAIRACLKSLKASGSGRILLFSTVAVQSGFPYHASVSAAKGAVEGLTRALSAEFAPKITVNAIAPSLTDTPLAARLLRTDKQREAAEARNPMGQIGRPEDVARFAAGLLTDETNYITGQVFSIDGGQSTLRV